MRCISKVGYFTNFSLIGISLKNLVEQRKNIYITVLLENLKILKIV